MNRVIGSLIEGRARPGTVDVSVAALLFAGAVLVLLLTAHSAPVAAFAVAVVATTVPLAWRSAFPVTTVAITTWGLAMAALLGFPAGDLIVPYLAPLVAVYSAGVHAPRPQILVAITIAVGAFVTVVVASPSDDLSDFGFIAAGIVAALVVGLAVRQMGFETDTLAERAAELERSHDETARAALAAERARIARELHDVIGHSISVMGVQAGAVRRVLRPEQERERHALLQVERIGRDAVTEMRRLLGFLRPADVVEQSAAPAPTLERVDELVEEMKRAGLEVDLTVEGDFDGLSAGRALAAFRILQEGLTNALKHAPGAHVSAVLRRTPEALVIEVEDDGGTGIRGASSGGGHGLVGIRERVGLYGVTVLAGPRDGQGYSVVARLPTADR